MKTRFVMTCAVLLAPLSTLAQQPMPMPMPGMPPQMQPPLRRGQQLQPLDMARGQRLYGMHCASCHGANGIPVVPNAPNFAMRQGMDKPDYELVQSLLTGMNMRTGKNHSPPYMGVLKEQEMTEIVQYLRIIR